MSPTDTVLRIQVAKDITDALARRGVSKGELARRMGCRRSVVSKICSGSQNLTLGTIARVCDALGCEFDHRLVEADSVGALKGAGGALPATASSEVRS